MKHLDPRPSNMISFPQWMHMSAFVGFFVALGVCSLAFFSYMMEIRYAVISILSVFIFFVIGSYYSREWAWKKEKTFLKGVFYLGFIVRVLWSSYLYFFNVYYYGDAFGDGADTTWYMPFAMDIAKALWGFDFAALPDVFRSYSPAFDDTGYPIFLGIEYFFIGGISDVFLPYVIKSALGAYCAVSIYHVAQRHYGEAVARLSAIFIALNPNLIYWCGTMMKEAEMVFLFCLFVDKMDAALNVPKITIAAVLPATLLGMTLFLFRSALGFVAFAAVFLNIVLTSDKVMSLGKKVTAGVLVSFVVVLGMGDRLLSQGERIRNAVKTDQQKENMEWRTQRKDASGHQNKLITKYATTVVFAPLIFTIPFPTFNQAYSSQILQQILSGGNYIKNILSFFVILSMFVMLLSGDWRRHVFIVAVTCGYLVALVFSNFAHSGRFHLPIFPMLMMFGAYGISLVNGNKNYRRWYIYALGAEVVLCVVWNWFKLAGRGMI